MNSLKENYGIVAVKKWKKGLFVTLLAILGITVLVIVGNVFFSRFSAISDAFSKEENILANTPYHVEIIEKDINNGLMTVQLDDEIIFNYICEVSPFGLDSGYGPFCSYVLPDGSYSIGEYIFHKNYERIVELSSKYRDTLEIGRSGQIKVKDLTKMKDFFFELTQIDDYDKAYKAFLGAEDSYQFRAQFDNIRLTGNIISEGESYSGMDLFDWAIREKILPRTP